MLDPNWDLIDGEAAHAIEVLNYANQINVIEALFRFAMHHGGTDKLGGCKNWPNDQACCELHRTGTLFLLKAPGVYRDVPVEVGNGTEVFYVPPPHEQVPVHMKTFFDELNAMWASASPVEVGAFCLWKLNWIHPFKNGNGRCARAFTYACLCLKFGMMLPGRSTVIDLVMADRGPYESALRAADKSLKETGVPDLGPMESYMHTLLIKQLSSIGEG